MSGDREMYSFEASSDGGYDILEPDGLSVVANVQSLCDAEALVSHLNRYS